MEALFSFFVGLVTAAVSFFTYVEPSPAPMVPDEPIAPVAQREVLLRTEDIETETSPAERSAVPSSADFVIASPLSGTMLKAGEELTIAWRLPDAVLSSFPADFRLGLFLNVVKDDMPSNNAYGIQDGTNDPRAGSVVWKVPADIVPGTYRIEGYLYAQPDDPERMCAVKVGKDCMPTDADMAIMARAQQYKDASEWFGVRAPVAQRTTQPKSTQTIQISQSQAYGLAVPAEWRAEASVTNTSSSGVVYNSIYVYDENDRLVMRIQQPIREIGYHGMMTVATSTLETVIGELEERTRVADSTVVGEASVAMAEGFSQYSWNGGGDFWNNSFEIFVHFRKSTFSKTGEDQQAGIGDAVRWESLGEFEAERPMIEEILKSIR